VHSTRDWLILILIAIGFPLGVGLLLSLGLWIVGTRSWRRWRRVWGEFAIRHGQELLEIRRGMFTFNMPYELVMGGQYRGYRVVVDMHLVAGLDHDIPMTRVVLHAQANLPGSITLRKKEHPFERGNVSSGDSEFDRRIAVTSRPQTFADRIPWASPLRERLIQFVAEGRGQVIIEGRWNALAITVMRPGRGEDSSYLQMLYDLAVDLADAIVGPQDVHAPIAGSRRY
jgi:hypothetical protein